MTVLILKNLKNLTLKIDLFHKYCHRTVIEVIKRISSTLSKSFAKKMKKKSKTGLSTLKEIKFKKKSLNQNSKKILLLSNLLMLKDPCTMFLNF